VRKKHLLPIHYLMLAKYLAAFAKVTPSFAGESYWLLIISRSPPAPDAISLRSWRAEISDLL
jgi:hypothetical protein